METSDILESRHGRIVCPSSLLYIPTEFRLGSMPLVENPKSCLSHLSFCYDLEIKNTLPELKRMGVKEMGFSHFYQELSDLVKNDESLYLNLQTEKWHSEVANLFYRYGTKAQASNIPLIPLCGGRWVKPSGKNVFLPGNITDPQLPGGLDVHLVDHNACQDTKRMEFFLWVGLKRCDQAEVCRMIMRLYNPFRGRTLADSVQDLIYLFQTPRTVYKGSVKELQFIGTGSTGFVHGSRLYIVYPNKTTLLSKCLGDPKSKMSTFDPAYIEAVRRLGKELVFISWASSYLKVSTLPRLADDNGVPTPEFYFLKANAVEDLLLLLRDNWNIYARHFFSNRSKLKRSISQMGVKCIDGVTRRLDETVLPLDTLKLAGPHLIFINIPDPEDSLWLHLSTFGVLTSPSTEFYLRELKALASAKALPEKNSPSKQAVQQIYIKLASDRESQSEIQ